MRLDTAYGIGRLTFAAATLLAPGTTGQVLAGPGGATADAQAFLRGIGARELGIATGLLSAIPSRTATTPWLIAGILADAGDAAGILAAWPQMQRGKREPGLTTAIAALAAGVTVLRTTTAP